MVTFPPWGLMVEKHLVMNCDDAVVQQWWLACRRHGQSQTCRFSVQIAGNRQLGTGVLWHVGQFPWLDPTCSELQRFHFTQGCLLEEFDDRVNSQQSHYFVELSERSSSFLIQLDWGLHGRACVCMLCFFGQSFSWLVIVTRGTAETNLAYLLLTIIAKPTRWQSTKSGWQWKELKCAVFKASACTACWLNSGEFVRWRVC